MTEVVANDQFAVWDNVLVNEDFAELTKFILAQKFSLSTDAGCMVTDAVYTEEFPTNNPLDYVAEAMMEACIRRNELTGTWNRLSLAAHIYQPATRANWSNDAGTTLIFYGHPNWKTWWGGELLIAKNTTNELDYGSMIAPKPNRLVLMRANVARKVCNGLDARICLVGSVSLVPQAKEQRESLGIYSSTDRRIQAETKTADTRAA